MSKQEIGHAPPNFNQLHTKNWPGVVHAPTVQAPIEMNLGGLLFSHFSHFLFEWHDRKCSPNHSIITRLTQCLLSRYAGYHHTSRLSLFANIYHGFLLAPFFLHFPFWPLCFAFDQAPRVVRHRVGEGRSRARVRHPAAEHLLDGTRHQGHGKLNLFTWYLVRYRVALHPLLEPLWDCTRVCRD